jgi:hypothetical protein
MSSLSRSRPLSWAFPDVTDQLKRFNGDLELEFSHEYEDILLDEETRLVGDFVDEDSECPDDTDTNND